MIKAVALDIYGTVLAADDSDNEMPPRRGLVKFFEHCRERNVPIITASDCSTDLLKVELRTCFESWPEHGMKLDMFFDHFLMNQLPVKDFAAFLDTLTEVHKIDLSPRELLVIGDSYKDIEGARQQGCPYFGVPQYRMDRKDDFDFGRIELDNIDLYRV